MASTRMVVFGMPVHRLNFDFSLQSCLIIFYYSQLENIIFCFHLFASFLTKVYLIRILNQITRVMRITVSLGDENQLEFLCYMICPVNCYTLYT